MGVKSELRIVRSNDGVAIVTVDADAIKRESVAEYADWNIAKCDDLDMGVSLKNLYDDYVSETEPLNRIGKRGFILELEAHHDIVATRRSPNHPTMFHGLILRETRRRVKHKLSNTTFNDFLRFVELCLVRDDSLGCFLLLKVAHDAYLNRCRLTGTEPMGKLVFGECLADLGFRREKYANDGYAGFANTHLTINY